MLKKFGLSPRCLTVFYRGTIKSILSGCITAWYGNSTAADRIALPRVIQWQEKVCEPSGIIRFLHKLVIKLDLIFI